jgi:hypothetical protein
MRQDKLEAAIDYLRSRGKYILDEGCKFKPTKAVQTDVRETIRAYRAEVEKIPPMTVVRGRKK